MTQKRGKWPAVIENRTKIFVRFGESEIMRSDTYRTVEIDGDEFVAITSRVLFFYERVLPLSTNKIEKNIG